MSPALLEAKRLSVTFGGVTALDRVDVALHEGEVLAVVGANGAGKSTLLNAIGGVVDRHAERLVVRERDLLSVRAHRVGSEGIGRSFQHPRLLPGQPVLDNLILAGVAGSYGMLRQLFLPHRTRAIDVLMHERAVELAERFGFGAYLHTPTASVPFGIQKKVDIARAVMRRPDVLLLDEPTSGLDPAEIDQVGAQIRQLLAHDCRSILLVEHNLRLVREIADRVVALETGAVLCDGAPEEVMSSQVFLDSLQGIAPVGPTDGLASR